MPASARRRPSLLRRPHRRGAARAGIAVAPSALRRRDRRRRALWPRRRGHEGRDRRLRRRGARFRARPRATTFPARSACSSPGTRKGRRSTARPRCSPGWTSKASGPTTPSSASRPTPPHLGEAIKIGRRGSLNGRLTITRRAGARRLSPSRQQSGEGADRGARRASTRRRSTRAPPISRRRISR